MIKRKSPHRETFFYLCGNLVAMNNMLLFLNMSGGEILVIVLVAYLVLGPKKIPEVARMIGKGINELRRATDDIRTEITREVNNIKKEANLNIKDPFIPDAYKRTIESYT